MVKPFQLIDFYQGLKRRFLPRPEGSPGAGVLISTSGGLGDTVMFAHVLPRVASLAREGEQVTVLIRSDARKMAFVFPEAVEVEAVDFTKLKKNACYRARVMDRLYNAHYRLWISTDYLRHPHLDEALMRAAAADATAAMEPRPWAKYDRQLQRNRALYDHLFDSGPVHLDKQVRWSRFADWLTRESAQARPGRLNRLPPAAKTSRPVVIVQPFSAVRAKQSPVALYRRLAAALTGTYDVIVTGAPGDLERNPEYEALVALPGVTFNSATFEEITPLLLAAALVISVDTALMHLAIAIGAPTLGLASSAYVDEIVPYHPSVTPENAHFIYHDMDCRGCLGNCIHPAENGMYPCVAALEPAAVEARVQALLDS